MWFYTGYEDFHVELTLDELETCLDRIVKSASEELACPFFAPDPIHVLMITHLTEEVRWIDHPTIVSKDL